MTTFHWWERLVNHGQYFPFHSPPLQIDFTSGIGCYQKACGKEKDDRMKWEDLKPLLCIYVKFILETPKLWWKLNKLIPKPTNLGCC